MVGEPSKTQKSGAWDRCCPKEDVLWEVICYRWDPWVGEGFIMSVILADPINKEKSKDGRYRGYLEVDSSWISA